MTAGPQRAPLDMRLLTNQRRPEEEQSLTLNHQEKITSLVWDTMNFGETVHLELKKEAADEDLGAFSPQAEHEAIASVRSLREQIDRGGEGDLDRNGTSLIKEKVMGAGRSLTEENSGKS